MARRTRQPRGQSWLRLPASPLLAAVEGRISIRAYLADARHPNRAQAIEELFDPATARAYYRAVAEGSLTLQAVEHFCDLFGWHPRELYGDAYDQVAFAGVPDGFDPWDDPALRAGEARSARLRLFVAISGLEAPARDLLRAYVTMGLRLDVLAALFRMSERKVWAGIVAAVRSLAPSLDADLTEALPKAMREELTGRADAAEGVAA